MTATASWPALFSRLLLRTPSAGLPTLRGNPPLVFTVGEMITVCAAFLTCREWLCPRLGNPTFAIALPLCFLGWFLYVSLVAPRYIHRDPDHLRGTGSWSTFGIRADNLRSATVPFAIATLAGASAILIATAILDPTSFSRVRPRAYAAKQFLYLGSAWIQAQIFFAYFLTRFRRLFAPGEGRFVSIVAIAFLFSLFHSPNPPLMVLSFVAGLAWAWLYYDRPNIVPLIASHAILGTMLSQVSGLNMKCGPNYWTGRSSIENLAPALAAWFFPPAG